MNLIDFQSASIRFKSFEFYGCDDLAIERNLKKDSKKNWIQFSFRKNFEIKLFRKKSFFFHSFIVLGLMMYVCLINYG